MKCDFSGYATRNNLRCSDGRTILKDAFLENDGKTVPLVWNHDHSSVDGVLGHALLENRDDGVYAYGFFNETESGKAAKQLVKNGDIKALSIYANRLKHDSKKNVIHGAIREVSLVLAGANPGAVIDNVLVHSDGREEFLDEGYISFYVPGDETNVIAHSDEDEEEPMDNDTLYHAEDENDEETVGDIYNTLTEKQKTVVEFLVSKALENAEDDDEDDETEGGDDNMKHNVFESEDVQDEYFSHSDEEAILSMAKNKSVGTLHNAMEMYAEEHLAHGITDIESLFPDYKNTNGDGAPEFLDRDQGWVTKVMNGVHKSPFSRIRTRFADIRDEDLRAYGYEKGKKKKNGPNFKLLKRTTDPQTVYRKDALNRDDIVDITDFDVVAYQHQVMKRDLNEEIAMAIMLGDGREDGDEDKISEEHIRPIWTDDPLYTIHADVDLAAAKAELQGTDTSKHFGDNYVYAEAIISTALYAREKFKGTGTPTFFCTPHLLNVMLLARDLNGRRIYDSKSDLTAALNVADICTCEQFEGKKRTDDKNVTKKLLGIFVNLSDYQVGSTKGGEITSFNQFDIDFNQEKYLIETRLSGALIRPWAAIVLEEPVTTGTSTTPPSGGGTTGTGNTEGKS